MTSRHSSCHLTSDGGNKATEADWEMARDRDKKNDVLRRRDKLLGV